MAGKRWLRSLRRQGSASARTAGWLFLEAWKKQKLEELARVFCEECGDIALIGCRILVNRLAREGNPKLPGILKF